jgi:hypothetical protein
MGTLGYSLTTLAFLAGAFVASLDSREIDWVYFVPCLLRGALGVFLIKKASMGHARSDETLANNKADIEDSLEKIVTNLTAMNVSKESIPPWELRFEIDHQFREDLNRFVEARHSLTHIYSLQVYAEIMSAFAAGERYLNRVWSASADGYVEEALDYIGRALEQFREAQQILGEAHADA